MSTVIVNCYHWIGFHFVEMLLESGEEVIGVHGKHSEKSSFLSMFFARNSLFTDKTSVPSTAKRIIVIGSTDKLPKSSSIIQCIYKDELQSVDKQKHAYIQMPLLFGEWMPMNETGIYVHNKHISFKSEKFKNEAVYVKDFIIRCLELFDEELVKLKKENSIEKKELILENEEFFRDNSIREKNIEKMQEHYLQYASFYYE